MENTFSKLFFDTEYRNDCRSKINYLKTEDSNIVTVATQEKGYYCKLIPIAKNGAVIYKKLSTDLEIPSQSS